MAIKYHFLDSGAFSLTTRAREHFEKYNLSKGEEWKWYRGSEMRAYLDQYARFIKEHADEIDLYANVDVIGNAELTWRNQQYLEHYHKLEPVPVVHYDPDVDASLEHLRKYIKVGYELIGLGGLVGHLSKLDCKHWLDQCFNDVICNSRNKLPVVKIHGFGVTQYEALLRYPWFSVDSSSWIQIASFGGILVPKKDDGEFTFTKQPYIMKFSTDSPQKSQRGKHYDTLSEMEKEVLEEWLKKINTPLDDGELGVMNSYGDRARANVLFFEMMSKYIKQWPWPFTADPRIGFV